MNIIRSKILSDINFLEHGFFDRTGGYSSGCFESLNVGLNRGDDENAVKNRAQIARYFGLPLSSLVILHQTHSDIVHIIDRANISQYEFSSAPQALKNVGDAVITNLPNVLIGVNTADCAPILLCDLKKKYIGVIHAGWRGAVGNIIENTCQTFSQLGCTDIIAAIGPCIHTLELQRTDVPEEYWKFFSQQNAATYFDLIGLVQTKLKAEGVREIEVINIDTRLDNNFFSFRRMQGKNGVQFSGLYLKE